VHGTEIKHQNSRQSGHFTKPTSTKLRQLQVSSIELTEEGYMEWMIDAALLLILGAMQMIAAIVLGAVMLRRDRQQGGSQQ
jgi:hypothetical protein